MDYCLKSLGLGQKRLIILILAAIAVGIFPFWESQIQTIRADKDGRVLDSTEILELVIFQGNSLASLSSPSGPEPRVVRKIRVVITGYSSTVWETDETPYITASGTWTRDGVIANNLLPIGTKVRFPELYGDKIFVVEDRMNSKKSYYHFDIWFPSYWEAKNFGAKRSYIEILEG